MAGEFGKTQRRIALNPQIAVFELGVRPGQFEGAAADIRIAVFDDQPHQLLARPRGHRHQRDLRHLPRFQRNTLPQDEHGIQHIAIGPVQRQHRVAPGASPPEALRAIRLVLERALALRAANH